MPVAPKLWRIQYEFLYPSSLGHFEYRRLKIREAASVAQDQLISFQPAFYFFQYLSSAKRPFPKPGSISLRFQEKIHQFFVPLKLTIQTKMHSLKSNRQLFFSKSVYKFKQNKREIIHKKGIFIINRSIRTLKINKINRKVTCTIFV